MRKSENKVTEILYKSQPESEGKRCRYSMQWLLSYKKAFDTRSFDLIDAKVTCMDREQGRAFMSAANGEKNRGEKNKK